MRALYTGVGYVGQNEVRERVRQDRSPVARHIRMSQQKVNQGRRKKDQAWKRIQEV